jgi:hypothetical protein
MRAALIVVMLIAALPAQAQQSVNINAELLAAARRGSAATVKTLLDQGAAIN